MAKTYVLSEDAGGTMTDCFLMDEEGSFVIGKAPTTRHDESIGFTESAQDAAGYWELGLFCDEMYKMSLNKAFLIVFTGRRPEKKLATYRSCM